MTKMLLLGAALALTIACAATAQPAPPSSGEAPAIALAPEVPAVDCAIEATPSAHGLLLRAFASADVEGEYDFVVTRSGAGGASDIVQSGEFSAGEDQLLGEAEFNLERGSRYSARLELHDADGLLCRDERSS
jgi:hypothetical protein